MMEDFFPYPPPPPHREVTNFAAEVHTAAGVGM